LPARYPAGSHRPAPAGDPAGEGRRVMTATPGTTAQGADPAEAALRRPRDRMPARLDLGPAAPEPDEAGRAAGKGKVGLLMIVLTAGLLVACLVSGMVGQLFIPPAQMLGALLHAVGLD